MSDQSIVPQSRRAILTAGLGAIAASVAGAFVRPAPVAAAGDDGTLIPIGGFFDDVRSQTTLGNQTNGEIVLWCSSNASGSAGSGQGIGVAGFSSNHIGVQGQSTFGTAVRAIGGNIGVDASAAFQEGASYGVKGHGPAGGVYGLGGTAGVVAVGDLYGLDASGGTAVNAAGGSIGVSATGATIGVHGSGGTGVIGQSSDGQGVAGTSQGHNGVFGSNTAAGVAATAGVNAGHGTGILGLSGGSFAQPATPAKTGVYGQATQDSTSRGVYGKSTAGRGVFGEASSGMGVRGFATSGIGLSGAAATGYALRTDGRLRFDKSGGSATINAGTSTVTVNPGIDLTASTVVVATLQGNAGGTTAVERVAINTVANTFQIILTANTTGAVKVGWLAFG